MKQQIITLSLPKDTVDLVKTFVGEDALNDFVIEVLMKALEEKREKLRKEYECANEDPDRNDVIRDWDALDGVDWND